MRILNLSVLAAIFCLCVVMRAHAEGGCPPGSYPIGSSAPGGAQGCAPLPDGGNDNQPPATRANWVSSWGAIATDGAVGSLGTVVGMPSENVAASAAIKDCQEKGGKSCVLEVTYANGCAAMVTGDKFHNSASGATETEAISKAMNSCKATDSNCVVFYHQCSPARLIR